METTLKYEFVNDQDGVMVFYFDNIYSYRHHLESVDEFMNAQGYVVRTHYTVNTASRSQMAYLPDHIYSFAVYFCNPEDFVIMKMSHG
tara:strand:+ start:20 stop:283 length:264 start_codon:yes stop_codon:yes gene_type:complete